jgi:ribosome-dependent ATPase
MVRRQDLPSTYFLAISVSTFTKALGLAALWRNIAALGVIAILYFVTSVALLDSGRLRR